MASSYFLLVMSELPFCFSFSASALTAGDGALGFDEEAVEDAAAVLAAPEALVFSLVLMNTSKIFFRVAGLTLSWAACSASVGSTPKASPMHWTSLHCGQKLFATG